MSLKFIIHADTRVVRRATTSPIEEVGLQDDEDFVEMPDGTQYNLADRIKVEVDGTVTRANALEINRSGIDPVIEHQKFLQKKEELDLIKKEIALIDPRNETVQSLAEKIKAYFERI